MLRGQQKTDRTTVERPDEMTALTTFVPFIPRVWNERSVSHLYYFIHWAMFTHNSISIREFCVLPCLEKLITKCTPIAFNMHFGPNCVVTHFFGRDKIYCKVFHISKVSCFMFANECRWVLHFHIWSIRRSCVIGVCHLLSLLSWYHLSNLNIESNLPSHLVTSLMITSWLNWNYPAKHGFSEFSKTV